jgi:hypothetical protein
MTLYIEQAYQALGNFPVDASLPPYQQLHAMLGDLRRLGVNADTLNQSGATAVALFYDSRTPRSGALEERKELKRVDWEDLMMNVPACLDHKVQKVYTHTIRYQNLLQAPKAEYDLLWNMADRLHALQLQTILAKQNRQELPDVTFSDTGEIASETIHQMCQAMNGIMQEATHAFANELSMEMLLQDIRLGF